VRDFLVNGARVLTTDDVADAVLEYAGALAGSGKAAVVRFPAVVEGQTGLTWMTVGAGAPVLAVQFDTEVPISLEGSEFAAHDIRRRTAHLAASESVPSDS
jgi:hypothetical protein